MPRVWGQVVLMAEDSCRMPGCDTPRNPDGDAFARQFCSAQCEVKYDHIRDDAADAQRSVEQAADSYAGP